MNTKSGEECKHENKSYAPYVLTSYPPQYPWICRDCGKNGVDRGTIAKENDYAAVKQKFE